MAADGAAALDPASGPGRPPVIVFGSSISDAEPYRRWAEPGIRHAREPDSEVHAYAAVGGFARTYNLLLDVAAAHDDLEALVLVHPHTEIVDPEFCTKVRRALTDPDVAVVGAVGATGVSSLAWWEGAVVSAPIVDRYQDFGGGELPAYAWTEARPAPAEVEVVDGWLLVLSPWAVRNVRFDEALHLGHGYDLDYCLQVREAGRKVLAADIRLVCHRSVELVKDLGLWAEAHVHLARKWEGRMPGHVDGASWKDRARRAEAEREAARALAYGYRLAMDARVQHLDRQMVEHTSSLSWRVTAPLRRLNRMRAEAQERRRESRPQRRA